MDESLTAVPGAYPGLNAPRCTFGSAALRVDARGAAAAAQPMELTSAGPHQNMPIWKEFFGYGLLPRTTTAILLLKQLQAGKQMLENTQSPGSR